MILTRKRLAALAATVSTLAVVVPAASASAQVPAFPGVGSLSAPGFGGLGFPSFPTPAPETFSGVGARIATVIGPVITGGVLAQGPGAGGQVAAAAPQAIALLSNTAGPTVAVGSG
jgi:hypothetical protein